MPFKGFLANSFSCQCGPSLVLFSTIIYPYILAKLGVKLDKTSSHRNLMRYFSLSVLRARVAFLLRISPRQRLLKVKGSPLSCASGSDWQKSDSPTALYQKLLWRLHLLRGILSEFSPVVENVKTTSSFVLKFSSCFLISEMSSCTGIFVSWLSINFSFERGVLTTNHRWT